MFSSFFSRSHRRAHRQQLLEQWVARLGAFIDIGSDRIGVRHGARKRPTGVADVVTIQSLVRKGEVADLVVGYGHSSPTNATIYLLSALRPSPVPSGRNTCWAYLQP
jgi:hypothetical protein